MRGSQLFNQLFEPANEVAERPRKGRSTELHTLRNEAIADRWYYYGIILKLQYQVAVEKVAADFFLSKHTIPEIITEQFGYIQRLKKEQIAARDLARKWRHLRWD